MSKRLLLSTLLLVSFCFGAFNANIIHPVMADDTEIFTGNGDVSENVRPNVLFILDNSGSMSASLSDGTRRTRIRR